MEAYPSKLLPGVASLFRNGPTSQQYCFTELPPPTCGSRTCSKGCAPKGSSSAADDNSSGEESNDDRNNDSDEASSQASSNSSEDDTFEAFGQSTAQRYSQFSPGNAKKDLKKSSRQKGDAASLKQYAYGEIYFLIFI
jgi:hypothetical protein